MLIFQTAQKENIFRLHKSYRFLLNKNFSQFIFILFKIAYFSTVSSACLGWELLWAFFLCCKQWSLALTKHNSLEHWLNLNDFQIQNSTLKVSLIILMALNIIYIFFKSWQLPAFIRITTGISLIKETSTLTQKHLIKCHLTHLPHTFRNRYLRIFATKTSSCLC